MTTAADGNPWNLPDQAAAPAPCLAMRLRKAAGALDVSPRSLWEWTRRGQVPCIRRGRMILYPVDALRRWLAEQTKAPEEKEGQDEAR